MRTSREAYSDGDESFLTNFKGDLVEDVEQNGCVAEEVVEVLKSRIEERQVPSSSAWMREWDSPAFPPASQADRWTAGTVVLQHLCDLCPPDERPLDPPNERLQDGSDSLSGDWPVASDEPL